MLTPTHWIAPAGGRFDVRTSHIAPFIADPGRFGVTEASLRALYGEHGERERFGYEGHARAAIIRSLLYNGWVHTRRWLGPHPALHPPGHLLGQNGG